MFTQSAAASGAATTVKVGPARTKAPEEAVRPGFTFNIQAEAVAVDREGDNLVIILQDERKVALEDFFTVAGQGDALPALVLDGVETAAADFLLGMNPHLDVTASTRTLSDGFGEYAVHAGDLINGMDAPEKSAIDRRSFGISLPNPTHSPKAFTFAATTSRRRQNGDRAFTPLQPPLAEMPDAPLPPEASSPPPVYERLFLLRPVAGQSALLDLPEGVQANSLVLEGNTIAFAPEAGKLRFTLPDPLYLSQGPMIYDYMSYLDNRGIEHVAQIILSDEIPAATEDVTDRVYDFHADRDILIPCDTGLTRTQDTGYGDGMILAAAGEEDVRVTAESDAHGDGGSISDFGRLMLDLAGGEDVSLNAAMLDDPARGNAGETTNGPVAGIGASGLHGTGTKDTAAAVCIACAHADATKDATVHGRQESMLAAGDR